MREYVELPTARPDRIRFGIAAVLVIFVFVATAHADDTIRVSAVALFKNKAALVINGKRRIQKVGTVSPEGVELIASSSESAVVKFNGEESTLRLDGRIVGNYTRGVAAKSLQLYPASNGHYFVDGLINGNSIQFLVDTGATAVVINKNEAKRIGLLYRVDGSPTTVHTASGIVPAFRVRFDEVKVRALSLKRVDGIVVDGNFPREALLGQSFLNRLNMRREGQMLELTER